MEESLAGKEFIITSSLESYTILQELSQGYLLVQNSAFKRAGIDAGIEMIHKSEIDGEYYKWS